MKLKVLRMIFMWLGVVIFFALLYKIGLEEISRHIGQIGWMVLPIFLTGLLWNMVYTLAWQQFLNGVKHTSTLWHLFKIKIAGEAVNTLTPINFIGGDPLRIFMLKRHLPLTQSAASVVVDRTIQMMATTFVVLIGVAATLPSLDFLPMNIKYGLPIVMMVATGFVTFILAHQHKGLFSFLMTLLKRLRIKRDFSPKTITKFQELDSHISAFYKTNRRGFWLALGYQIGGRLLGILEVFLIGYALDSNFSLFLAVILATVAPIVNFLFTFVPGAIGIMEGAYGIVILYFGFPASLGISIQLIKRLRSVIWIALGLMTLSSRDRQEMFNSKVAENL